MKTGDGLYDIRREWLLPFLVSVWRNEGKGVDFRGRAFTEWWRIGTFYRRSTAMRFVEWHRETIGRFLPSIRTEDTE